MTSEAERKEDNAEEGKGQKKARSCSPLCARNKRRIFLARKVGKFSHPIFSYHFCNGIRNLAWILRAINRDGTLPLASEK